MRRLTPRAAAVALSCAGLALSSAVGARAIPPPGAGSCRAFPPDNVWHADITRLPVNRHSAAWIASMGGPSRHLHPDFGPSGGSMPYGIPYIVVPSSHKKVSIQFQYADESDPGPYPFGPDTPIEGGSDRHAIMIDSGTCTLYELFDAQYSSGGSTAGSGAIWSLRSDALRPATWTSADAAGLPIFAGLVRLDEVNAGVVDHAIRVTASSTDRSYLWPARHQAGAASDPNLPPMGARFRLKSGFDISGYRSDTRVILTAMKRYGLIVADNGSDWYISGTAENGWQNAMLDELKTIPAGAFEAVDESSLMADPNSGRVRVASATPGIPANPQPHTARPSGTTLPRHASPSATPHATPPATAGPSDATAAPSRSPLAVPEVGRSDGIGWELALGGGAALGIAALFFVALRRRRAT